MKANATCRRCGCRWHLEANVSHGTAKCDRKVGRRKCGGSVVRDGDELLVGSYVRRRDGKSCRVVRYAGRREYAAYVDGVLVYEGSRAGAMDRAR